MKFHFKKPKLSSSTLAFRNCLWFPNRAGATGVAVEGREAQGATHPGAKSTWHMGQLCRVVAESTDGCRWEGCSSNACSSALGVPRSWGAGCFGGDPVRPRTALSTRSEPPESPPRPGGGGGKGVQKKVSVPTVNLSGGGRSGLRLGSCKKRSSDRAHLPALAQLETRGHAGATAHAPGRGRRAAAAARRPRSGLRLRCAATESTASRTRRRPGGTGGDCSEAWGGEGGHNNSARGKREAGPSGTERRTQRGETRGAALQPGGSGVGGGLTGRDRGGFQGARGGVTPGYHLAGDTRPHPGRFPPPAPRRPQPQPPTSPGPRGWLPTAQTQPRPPRSLHPPRRRASGGNERPARQTPPPTQTPPTTRHTPRTPPRAAPPR